MSEVRAIGLAFMNALWAGDIGTCHVMMSEDARWYFQLGMPQAKLGQGHVWPAREALQRIVEDLFGKFDESGFSVQASRAIADEGSVAIEYEANGRTSKGDVYQNFYCTTLTIVDGKVTEIRPYNDTAHMLSLLS
jgi:ketosteroid isomerase-like protein